MTIKVTPEELAQQAARLKNINILLQNLDNSIKACVNVNKSGYPEFDNQVASIRKEIYHQSNVLWSIIKDNVKILSDSSYKFAHAEAISQRALNDFVKYKQSLFDALPDIISIKEWEKGLKNYGNLDVDDIEWDSELNLASKIKAEYSDVLDPDVTFDIKSNATDLLTLSISTAAAAKFFVEVFHCFSV